MKVKNAKTKKSKPAASGSRAPPRKRLANQKNPTFGPVTSITTAPVAIGNSMKGASARVIERSLEKVRIQGRDFAFPAQATGTVTGWTLVGGFPLTPAAFVSSILRSYSQMYNKFKFNAIAVHYITSSSTSSTGDILFQINKNRTDPCANNSASTFLSYALSDENSVLGPQWTNHTALFKPVGPFRNLNYGSNVDLDYQAQGEVMLYSKTSTTDSPGYVIIDYDVSFSELSINPKAGLIPNNNIMYQPVQLICAAGSKTSANSFTLTCGTRWVGNQVITALTSTPSFGAGDVYKVVLDMTNTVAANWTVSAGTQPTAANLVSGVVNNTSIATTLSDGFTAYLVFYSTTSCEIIMSASGIAAAGNSAASTTVYGLVTTINTYAETAGVPSAGVWLYGMASYVGSLAGNRNQQQ